MLQSYQLYDQSEIIRYALFGLAWGFGAGRVARSWDEWWFGVLALTGFGLGIAAGEDWGRWTLLLLGALGGFFLGKKDWQTRC